MEFLCTGKKIQLMIRKYFKHTFHTRRNLWGIGLLLIGSLLLVAAIFAQDSAQAQDDRKPQGSPIHPLFPLLDADGVNVLESGAPVSTMQTCGACHDAEFIAGHSFHADVGLGSLTESGDIDGGREWDYSIGYFGQWNPITYRYLSPSDDEIVDMTTAEWVQSFGLRHAGGGPALLSQEGIPLAELVLDINNPQTSIVNADGTLSEWNWSESGTIEMNCFLCHLTETGNETRMATIAASDFAWANTATLVDTGVVAQDDDGWTWNTEAFNANGDVMNEYVGVQDPTRENCGQCHGVVHTDAQDPLVLDANCDTSDWTTLTTGQVISPQKIANSGSNIAGKSDLTRSFDIHAERVLECVNCHYSLNNPVYYQEDEDSRPDHLIFDPRRLDIGEYLLRPVHNFATGPNLASSDTAPTMRTCESCHAMQASHDWLPYQERHATALACESCHIPKLYGSALQSIDWTVLQIDGTPIKECRGVEGDPTININALITGFEPVLLPRENTDGSVALAPHNLVSAWYWIYGNPARPVPQAYLQGAFLADGAYHDDILTTFDADNDGVLSTAELVIDNDAKENLVKSRLEALGLTNPRIEGEVLPYNINHNVTHADYAVRECDACHSNESLITQDFLLSNRLPGDVMPRFQERNAALISGDFTLEDGKLYYEPQTSTDNLTLYVLGHDRVPLVDWIGLLFFVGTLLGVFGHSTMRYMSARKRPAHDVRLEKVYMYSVYERQWHWLQTAVILLLLVTGLIIHKPDFFGMFSFPFVVQVHNILALILVINAFLAAFYHLASGDIAQFVPQPRGFFYQAYQQAWFYLRGIFRGDPHPFAKDTEHKLNPLQQITYLAILNIILPAQVITGALMWGAQTYPDLTESIGGLTYLAPIHSLVAWTFAAFIVMHVYLTTTAHTPLAGIRAMIVGWDELEIHTENEANAEVDASSEASSVENED